MPGGPTIDNVLYGVSTALALLNFVGTTWKVASRLITKDGDGGNKKEGGNYLFLIVAFLSSVFYAISAIIAQIYHEVRFLVPQVRYFAVYLMLNLPTAMLYLLYERRLSLLFSFVGKTTARIYSIVLLTLIAFYLAITVWVSYEHILYAVNDSEGGYHAEPPNGEYHLVINYSADMCIGSVILIGTAHALIGTVRDQFSSSNSAAIYRIILGSDCVKYLVIAAIEAYKTTCASDPNGVLGTIPEGNGGLQHTIDAIKIGLMTFNLFAPVAVARTVASKISSKSTGGGASSGLKSSMFGGKASTAPAAAEEV
ncbi:hypothetical protein DFJ73DRAFT_831094 [Zopfochytrium polystomum]|nr:hypothetical protein DFJ73DRAFT_831094 [Zopfochytrium polystomum]